MGKKKEDKPTKDKPTTFEGKINKYGFLHFGKDLRKAWDIQKDVEYSVTIELTPENALIIRKTDSSPLDE